MTSDSSSSRMNDSGPQAAPKATASAPSNVSVSRNSQGQTVIIFNGSGGTIDDSAALEQAVNQFQAAPDGATLVLRNKILYARKKGMMINGSSGAAIVVRGGNNKTINFDATSGSELIMHNLTANGEGTSGGITWLGGGRGDVITNASISWQPAAAARSIGDGIRITGYPGNSQVAAGWSYSTGTMSDFTLTNWNVSGAPQTGAIIMGVNHPVVTNGKVDSTKADGLHINASSNPVVQNYNATNTGDDGLALVTYYDPSVVASSSTGPFSQPLLGAFSNSNAVINNVTVQGGRANGLRVEGGLDITATNISVSGKGTSCVIIDSGKESASHYKSQISSRGINMSNLKLTGCGNGIQFAAIGLTASDPDYYYNFQASFTNVIVTNSRKYDYVITANQSISNTIRNGITFPAGAVVYGSD